MRIDQIKLENKLLHNKWPQLNYAELFVWRWIYYYDARVAEMKLMEDCASGEKGSSWQQQRGAREALDFIHDPYNYNWLDQTTNKVLGMEGRGYV